MRLHLPTRLCLGAGLAVLMTAAPAEARWGGGGRGGAPQARMGGRPPATRQQTPRQQQARPSEPNLQRWMDQHKGLAPAEQQRELEKELGFRDQSPQMQQRMRDQLGRLNTMNPNERQRMLNRNEIMERLPAQQRSQYLVAARSFAGMAPERQRLITRSIIDLRGMSPEERQTTMESARFRGQFSEGEFMTLNNLMVVEAYAP